MTSLTLAQITGCDDAHLVSLPCGHQMQAEAAQAYQRLAVDADQAGFRLAIASSFRSFERQLAIWNGKASGNRPVHDDLGAEIVMSGLSAVEQLHAILRFSALPGASRHHWGTDIDVYDAAAVDEGYCVQLTPQEVAPKGIFDAFHCWLDDKIAAGESQGFYRPYERDTGGVACERWHLSYKPVAASCAGHLSSELLVQCWNGCGRQLLLKPEIEALLSEIMARYVELKE